MEHVHDFARYRTHWIIRKYADEEAYRQGIAFEESHIQGNLLLNEGITRALNLIAGLGGTAFNNANARIGVGDSTTAAAAGQTDLQAVTNKTYKAMESGYPQVSGQTITFRSVFGPLEANYAWQEFVVDNGGTAGEALNRKVSDQGTKASGQTWTMDVAITLA
jgi:hypothetical protein